jgi:hypothetical protein
MMFAMGKAFRRLVLLCTAFGAGFLMPASPAAAKSYSAERFDSVVRALPDGILDVTETVVFRFEDGTFREVFREIPLRRTDGIEVIRAEMQGQRLPFGNEPGTVEVRHRSSRIRVVWRFGPSEGITREFVLNYRVRGAVRHTPAGDLLLWRSLPGEHQYRIESTTTRFELPLAPSKAPEVEVRKGGRPQTTVDGTFVRVQSSDVRANGWIETSLTFPLRAVAATPPVWQQHAAEVAGQAAGWIISAGAVLFAGLILLLAWRQSYDPPPKDLYPHRGEAHPPGPPDSLAPPVGGVLASNGRVGLEHAMAALFSLADRGELDIEEKPRGSFGQRDFLLTRHGLHDLVGYDGAAVETIFKDQARQVTLSQARSRLTWKLGHFTRAMTRELSAAALLEPARQSIKDRYKHAGVWLLIAAGLAAIPAAFLIDTRGAWPMLIPGAVLVVAIGAFIFGAATTPLSNDGVRRAARWREFRSHLTAVAHGKRSPAGLAIATLLPYAVALGLADAWSKFLKQQGHTVPKWFHALPASDGESAFPVFIATGGAGVAAGGQSHGAGGAAGGGASGAR